MLARQLSLHCYDADTAALVEWERERDEELWKELELCIIYIFQGYFLRKILLCQWKDFLDFIKTLHYQKIKFT